MGLSRSKFKAHGIDQNDSHHWYKGYYWRTFVFTDPKEYLYSHLNGFHELCRIEVMGNEIDNPDLLRNILCQTPEKFEKEILSIAREKGIIH